MRHQTHQPPDAGEQLRHPQPGGSGGIVKAIHGNRQFAAVVRGSLEYHELEREGWTRQDLPPESPLVIFSTRIQRPNA
jgi:hypothetical protein